MNFIKSYKEDIQIIIIYAILTVIFTYPVMFSSEIPGTADADVFQYLWFLWWFDKSLLNFSSPYETDYIFHPTGVNLAFSAMNAANSILSVPIQQIFGLILTYKIIWLASFFISGYGTYLLVKYLTNNKKAAFIAGLIFMFSPYHFARGFAGHLNLIVIQWIPFYILFLYKTIHENKQRYAIYAAIFLLLNSTEYHYFIYMMIFSGIFLLYNQLVYKNILKKDVIKRLTILYILFGILFFPFVFPLLKELLTTDSSYMYSGGYIRYSADFLAFFIPTPLHPIFGQYVDSIYKNFGPLQMVFMGYTAIFLAIISIYRVKNKENRFWIFSAIISFLFALGPVFHFNGNLYDLFFLPYNLLEKIPIISIARAPSRWDVLVMLSLGVVAGYGLDYLFKRNDKRINKENGKYEKYENGKVIFTILLSGLIIFEYLVVPFPMSSSKIPEFYHQLKNESGDYAILEIPNLANNGIYMYYQTFHEKKLVNGYVSRTPPEATAFKQLTPIINILSNPPKDININNNFIDSQKSILNYYNIRYIVLHENFMNKERIDITNYLLQNISDKKTYKEDQMTVYTIENKKIEKPFILLKNNWFDTKISKDRLNSWMANNATILVYSPGTNDFNFSMESRSFYKQRQLEIYLNNEMVHQQIIKTKLGQINVKLKFQKGENMIRLYTPDTCQRPIDIPELKNNNTKCLSMLFSQSLNKNLK